MKKPQKRVFIIHGWDGHPKEGWFPWLKNELIKLNFIVEVPQLPQPEEPRISNWVEFIQEMSGLVDNQTYFIGHSIGCQAIARYLERLSDNTIIGGAVFVAGFFKRLTNLEDDEVVRSVSNEWLKTPINLEKVKSRLNKSLAIFSDNDPYVPIDNIDDFQNILKSEIIIEKSQGHFSEKDGLNSLPIVLESLIKISEN